MFCSTCGGKVGATWYACATCGTPLSRSSAPPTAGSRPTTTAPPPPGGVPRGGLSFWQLTLAVFTGSWVLPMLVSFAVACILGVVGLLMLGAVANSVPRPPRTPALAPPTARWTPIADFPTPVFPVEPARPAALPTTPPRSQPSPSPTLVVQDGARWERQAGGLWRVTRADGTVEYVSQGPPR